MLHETFSQNHPHLEPNQPITVQSNLIIFSSDTYMEVLRGKCLPRITQLIYEEAKFQSAQPWLQSVEQVSLPAELDHLCHGGSRDKNHGHSQAGNRSRRNNVLATTRKISHPSQLSFVPLSEAGDCCSRIGALDQFAKGLTRLHCVKTQR